MAVRVHVFFVLYAFLSLGVAARIEDNEFAEFEEDDSFEEVLRQPDSSQYEEADFATEDAEDAGAGDSFDEDADFSDIVSSDEDEGDDDDDEAEVEVEEETEEDDVIMEDKDKRFKKGRPEDIELAQSDVPVSRGIHDYWTEIIIVAGMSVYLLNYLLGRSRNGQIATRW